MRRLPSNSIMAAAALTALAVMLLVAVPASPFLPSMTSAQNDHWDFTAFPVAWNLNAATGSNIKGSTAVEQVISSAFNTWASAPNASLAIAPGGPSSVSSESSSPAAINLICFVCADADFSKDSNTLAVTITTTANAAGQSDGHGGTTRFAGQIIKADIIFNPSVQFTTGGTAGQDLQTVATHEIGHFFGLDHSAVVRAVMFPFASSLTTLSYDDVAGLSVLYPKSNPDVPTGTISGTVTLSSGGSVFGAHVYTDSVTAAEPFAGNIRKSPIGTLTNPSGNYTIQGVPPDSYIVVAEPLDLPVTNSDVAQFPGNFGQKSVQTNFTTRWH